MNAREADLIIVGAGFYGATIAERAADAGYKVIIIEKRDHIGGNAYTYIEKETGIEIHKYGPHIFHTNSDEIFSYLSRFTTWTRYEHRLWTKSGGKIFPLPINLATISLFAEKFLSPAEAKSWVQHEAGNFQNPTNLEEKAISLIGKPLYEAFIRGYTLKQWQTDPKLLPAEIITRLPVRYTFDNRYFNDKYQFLPTEGYTHIFENMLKNKNINIKLSTDWVDFKPECRGRPVIYTGPIDRYFEYRLGNLGWRTIDLELETHEGDFQGCAVMNYADLDVSWTRISEFKHFRPDRPVLEKTIIAREYSRSAQSGDEPYYPINLQHDKALFGAYRALGRSEKDVLFGGRLGSYQYLDMHQAIGAALVAWERHVRPRLTDNVNLETQE